ncbi:spore coat protein [Bacillus sp. C28GYM-DRY-1]|uniref:spore coat protein n=1 Tax=Bacillus sp. C28GYM-DRY-1 TaxID=3062686 RepID=UPI002674D1AF|nr:spore coat protein [Bacillus sp. C28GYM-DRY-1]MDO3660101.1 spore coat protein [Bacillus sp. C28GYM-DRY-1]
MESKPYSWVALDRTCPHPGENNQRESVCASNHCSSGHHNDPNILQDADLVNINKQISEELIIVRDSCDIDVRTSDTQVAVSIQLAIQVAIAVIVNISIADGELADEVIQDLMEKTVNKQANRQKLVIENSRNVNVTTEDTDVALSIQLLVQILVAVIIAIGIL